MDEISAEQAKEYELRKVRRHSENYFIFECASVIKVSIQSFDLPLFF